MTTRSRLPMAGGSRTSLPRIMLVMLSSALGCGGGTAGLLAPRQPLTRAPDEPFRRLPPSTPDAPPLRAPAMTEVQLPNGLTLVVIPRPGWPTVSLVVVTRANESDYEPGALDLATAYVERLATLRQPDATLSSGVSLTGGSLSGTAQTRDLEAVLGVLSDAIQGPLDSEAMQQARESLLLNEQMSTSSPLGNGRAFAAQAIYLPSPAFGELRRNRYRSIASISPSTVSTVVRDAYRPTDTAVMLVGDITPERGRALVEPRFGAAYVASPREPRNIPSPNATTTALGVEAMRSSQLQLVYGLRTPDLDAPDWAAYQVLAAVLAGGFTSSLNTRIRHELGASYGVRWGGWHTFPGRAGFIEARIDVDQTVPALQAFFRELERVRRAPLPLAELTRAQRVVWGEWENSFATPAGLLLVCERAFLARFSVAELAERANTTRFVTAQAVQAVAQERLDPIHNVVVLTGALEGMRGHQVSRTAHGFQVIPAP